MKRLALAAVALALVVIVPAPARAAPERPWAEGVTPAQQTEALAIFKEGNALFAESQHAAALAKYRQALAVWDHPAIRYNAAVALINLDQPLQAYAELEAALRFGEAPFDGETYKQALLYKKLVGGQLAELEVRCQEPGAEVMLDGALLFGAPGERARRLMPGPHQLVARKAGFLTATRALQLVPGQVTKESIALVALSSLPSRYVRRWAAWKPWTVLGAGVLVALIGAPLMADAKSNFDSFDSAIARLCAGGCTSAQLPSTVLAAQSRGRAENGAAIGLFAAGGALAASGVVLLILNQPRIEAQRSVAVAPMVGPGLAGVQLGFRR